VEDPNAKWSHALPLEETRLWDDKKAELEFMKDLFFERLPIGKDTKQIEEHFNRLEEAIANKENINHDEFPDYDTVDLDGAVQDPPKDYHYFSAAVLKQQADRGRINLDRHPIAALDEPSPEQEDMDTTPDGQTCDSASSESEINGDLQPDAVSTNWDADHHSDGDY
jgi:hypothetical protein